MEELIVLFFKFGYLLIFGILGATSFLLHIPKTMGIESYRKARITLGCSTVTLAVYCLVSIIFNKEIVGYTEFWLLTTFTLIHSWLTYSSLLFLMETPRYKTRAFIIDGAIPTTLMLATGFIGLYRESIQHVMIILFGCVFSGKCLWMIFTCLREYKQCEEELSNFYSGELNIKWIRNLLIVSLIMSISTVVAFYVKAIHAIYYSLIPIIYIYIVFKVVNFAPKKIDQIRAKNLLMTEKESQEAPKAKRKDIAEKVKPLVDGWVAEKGFCRPELTIKDVAAEIGTNQNYLSTYINTFLEVSFQVWLNTLRIEESKNILITEKISIEDVGIKVGIPQSYNFSRWFRIVTSTTPYQYRKQHVATRS